MDGKHLRAEREDRLTCGGQCTRVLSVDDDPAVAAGQRQLGPPAVRNLL